MQRSRKCRVFPCLWIAVWTAATLSWEQLALADDSRSDRPVFQVDASHPTADKPQSKLWFARGTWWVWLPDGTGSSIWQRAAGGWRRATALDDALQHVPGRADVWHEGDLVRAVLVDRRRLTTVVLRFDDDVNGYVMCNQPVQLDVEEGEKSDTIETATIARDGRDTWWIAYPWQRRMWVRAMVDSGAWSEPSAISEETSADDLCAIVALPGGVGVAWSNQARETMNFRLHKDGASIKDWERIEEIDRDNRCADDHINGKAAADGTLILATKNSLDRIGKAQLVLRVRDPNGGWKNLPYVPRTASTEPSRPLVLLSEHPPRLLLLHTEYDRSTPRAGAGARHDRIVWQTAPVGHWDALALAVPSAPLIQPAAAVNNATGCKATLPDGHPWVVLASDAAGNVYEGRLDLTECRPIAPRSATR